jgi:hypothetical protein
MSQDRYGLAVLSPRTAQRMSGGLEAGGAHGYVPMSHKTAATVARAIGIDTGSVATHYAEHQDLG